MRHIPLVLLLGLIAWRCGDGNAPPAGQSSVGLVPVASGLSFPVDLTSPPADSARLFVVEKTGTIRIIRNGAVVPRPFLDLRGAVSGGGEQGLLGLAFHPQYAVNGRFVVNFTNPGGDTRVVAYRVSTDPDSADPATADTILAVSQPYSNHNGGGVRFGPDGYLYVGLGDGGSAGDPQDHGQDRTDLLGSLLRLDIDPGPGYTIPPTNPYAGSTQNRPELWNYGLRNPWRFSFDRQTGDLYIGDVGQGDREEIDVQPAGAAGGENYGWRLMEGTRCYNPSNCNPSGLTLPVLDYTHSDGCSVTGGFVYRGQAVPALQGLYLYSDYCAGWVRSFRYQNGSATDQRSWPTLSPGGQVTSYGEDAAGELYLLVAGGTVFRVVER